jgi:hypothetical protein
MCLLRGADRIVKHTAGLGPWRVNYIIIHSAVTVIRPADGHTSASDLTTTQRERSVIRTMEQQSLPATRLLRHRQHNDWCSNATGLL